MAMLSVSLLAGSVTPAFAQRTGPREDLRDDEPAAGSPARRIRYTVVGTLIGAALAGAYYSISDKKEPTSCDPLGCALPYLSVSGALTGLFLAREIDAQRRAEMPRAGVRDRLSLASVTLPSMPNGMSVRDTLVAIASDSGISIFAAEAQPRALRRRGVGLRGLREVALLPGNDRLLMSSAVALYGASTTSGPASRLLDGAVSAIASGADGWIAARGSSVAIERTRDGATRRDSIDVGENVQSATYDESTMSWWVGTDSSLLRIEMTTAALRIAERISTGSPVRAVAASRTWVAAALGEAGVAAWRRLGATGGVVTPVRVQSEPRFAYDLAFYEGTLLVAGGTDGLVRIGLDPVPTVLGVSRDLPFATLVKVDAKNGIWVGDRGKGTLNKVTYPR